jgi:hypothetical protein
MNSMKLMHSLDIVAFILFAAIAVTSAIYKYIYGAKRREGLIDLARRLNLSFDAGQHHTLADDYSFLKQLDKGDNRYATNILSGTYQQYPVVAFDYHYETYSTDSKGRQQTLHHWLSLVILTLPGVFPELSIRREGIFTKIAEVFGYEAIKFESAEFSKHFCVRSSDKKFAYDFCNAGMIEYLLANRDLSVEIENQALAMVFTSRLSVAQFENDLRRLVEIRARFPQYLIGST